MIGIQAVYLLAGLVFAAFATLSAGDRANPRRFGNAAFWGLVALSFLAGDRLGDRGNGVLVLGLAAIAGLGGLGRGQPATTTPAERHDLAARLGDRLFLPALTLPLVVAFGVLVLKPLAFGGQPLLDPKQATVISLALAAIVATAVALVTLRQPLISQGTTPLTTAGATAKNTMLPRTADRGLIPGHPPRVATAGRAGGGGGSGRCAPTRRLPP